jgi:DNA-binding transcriptional LysR family regulator
METRQLKMFCAVAEKGSLIGAAERLHLTSSALSHGVKSLEAQLGCRLFDRVAKKMVLNQAGEQLLAAVRGPLEALEDAAASLKHLGKWGQTRLRVGAASSICQHLLPPVIGELRTLHKNLEVHLEAGDTPYLVERLHGSKIDLAIGVAPEIQGTLQVRQLFRDELMFAFGPAHSWVAGRPISREELRSQPFIFYNSSSVSARFVQAFFKSMEIVPTVLMEVGNLEAIKEMVKLNLGVAILAPWVAAQELANGSLRLRPMAAKPLRRRWIMLCAHGRRLNLAEEEFFGLCRRQAGCLRLDRRGVAEFNGR